MNKKCCVYFEDNQRIALIIYVINFHFREMLNSNFFDNAL